MHNFIGTQIKIDGATNKLIKSKLNMQSFVTLDYNEVKRFLGISLKKITIIISK